MALTAYPNQLSFSQIQTEFGGSNPISLSEYYAGNANGYVPAGTIGGLNGGSVAIPTSGAISVGNFHNSQRVFVFNVTYSGTRTDTNVLQDAITAGWNSYSSVPIIINCTVATGAVLQASTTGNYGLTVYRAMGWPSGSVMNLTITSGSYILGKGGKGGNGQQYGGEMGGLGGGPALIINIPTAFINNGVICGGGGGGGGGYQGDLPFGGGGGGGGNGFGLGGLTVQTYTSSNTDKQNNTTYTYIDTGNRAGATGGALTGGAGGSGGSYNGYGNDRWGYGGGAGGSNAGSGVYFYSSYNGSIRSAAPGAGGYAYYGANYVTSYTGSGSVVGGHGGNT